jgi:RNA polymerase sigma-70 factor (ECF subfamily)
MNKEEVSIINDFQKEGTKLKAFESLVELYQERVYWQIRRMLHSHEDSNDVAQEVWVKLWRSLDKFRGDSALYSYIYRIAFNETLMFIKKRDKHTKINAEYKETLLENFLSSDPYFDGDETMIKLKSIVSILPAKQQAVFNLKYFENLKYQEIAQILLTSVGALKASYHHARKKVEHLITKD